jgi:hypothetical protein
MRQGTAEIKKMESRERAKIVNFASIKLWISYLPENIESPNLQETEKVEKDNITRKFMKRFQNSNESRAQKQLLKEIIKSHEINSFQLLQKHPS